ncbi:hypothetical protein PTTG_11796 [Puccinia triticina 1-1 BBBD Race 1]|uniref:Uncharacterized protein n=1 Tax=Puccinia triticina (isolate 1-1 / race 1 (BBBD)) TaxID=630390 RepID=A0A180GZE5_PUCT1|nr:hypothetical protein PTTG_11796 [Puccinia triticina 1-1 BBBD Race 1]
MFNCQLTKLTTKINQNSPSLARQSTSKSTPSPSTKSSPPRRPIKKAYRARDPLNPLLDHFITGAACLSRSSHPPSSARLGHPRDPVSGTLAELERSKKIYSSSQAMDRSIQKLIKINPLPPPPPQPSTSKFSLDHYPPHQSHSLPLSSSSSSSSREPTFRSLEQALQWTQIYIRFLKSSPNQEVFARRIKELIHRRLPKRLIEPIIRFHSTEEGLVSIQSYNHLIAYYYQSERYHLARRLIKEMEERGIPKNQETQELIACSYQALNKFKGVQLTLDAIKADGHQVSDQCLTRLFSIRPRRPSKLEHFDSMDDPVPSGSDPPPTKPCSKKTLLARTEEQSWMPIEDFLKHHRWDSEYVRKDGRALVTLTKRLMELGRWKEAKEFVEMILNLDLKRSAAESSRLDITPYWATSLLEALVFGLYNLKRQRPTDDSPSTKSDRLPVECVFRFVERFIDQHPEHLIKANSRTLLNCLRIQTFLAPSEVHRISQVWTSRYGLDAKLMGSRTGIRFLHVISAWFVRLLRSTQALISTLDRSSPSSSSLVEEIQANLNQLVNEYLIIDEHLIECLDLDVPRAESSAKTGSQTEQSREELLIERLILNGPVDGKLVRMKYRFISTQDLQSIKSSLQKIFKIRPKIAKLMTLHFHAILNPSSEAKRDKADSTWALIDFYRPILGGDLHLSKFLSDPSHDRDGQTFSPFNQKFYSLIDRFKTQVDHHTAQDHPRQLTLDLVPKLPGSRHAPAPAQLNPHPPAHHTLLCWRSEDRHSVPIYFKSSSS